MNSITRGVVQLFGVSLVVGLFWNAGHSRLHAQPPLVPDITVQPSPSPATPEANSNEKTKAPTSFWAKIPDLLAPARPGLFLLPPSGSGYYTALDAFRGNCQEKAPPYPYRAVFYDNDFRYLDKPDGKPINLAWTISNASISDRYSTPATKIGCCPSAVRNASSSSKRTAATTAASPGPTTTTNCCATRLRRPVVPGFGGRLRRIHRRPVL